MYSKTEKNLNTTLWPLDWQNVLKFENIKYGKVLDQQLS